MIKSRFMKVGLLAAVLAYLPAAALANDYNIDPAHSKLTFKVKHLGISWVPGKFNDFSGSFSYDPNNVAVSKAAAVIKAQSIDTDNEKRDGHLKSPDFLYADNFPEISFDTTKVKPGGKNKFKASGNLKIKDISKPVTLDVVFNGAAKGMQGEERAAFTATTTLNRKDWGITWNKLIEAGGLAVGDQVLVTIEIEAVKAGTEPKSAETAPPQEAPKI